MKQNIFIKTTLVLALAMFFGAPYIAVAQEATDAQTPAAADPTQTASVAPQAPDSAAAPDAATSSNPPSTDSPTTGEAVQDTANTQDAADGSVLEGTANPEADVPPQTDTIPVEAATSSEASTSTVIEIPDATPALAPDEIPMPAQSDLTVVATDVKPEAPTAPTNAELNAMIEPEFVTQLSGKTIPTEQKDNKTGKTIQTITAAADASIDGTTGNLHLAGSCSSTYFVVLLFRNQTDYDTDPRSYILNKAFPCENDRYAYSVDDLPPTLSNGTYYLLVGEEGDTGPWKPVTGLTEITIHRQ